MRFKCNNAECSAPENKKGKVYPSAMECPFCDEPLVAFENIDDSDRLLIESLPYVIAYPLKRAITENHAGTKINLLKDTFLNYLKYLALLTASEFFNSPIKDKNMIELFKRTLYETSFGLWNEFIRETLKFLNDKQFNFFCPELNMYYNTVQTGKNRKLYKIEVQVEDVYGDSKITQNKLTGIDSLINFRNRYLGHQQTLDDATYMRLWDQYFPIFRDLLEQMTFCKNYPMYKTEHDETYRLHTNEIKLIEVLKGSYANTWIEDGNGNRLEILPFFIVPGELSIKKDDKEKILVYESYTGSTIKFFSPEGTEKQTSGKILERLNMLLRDKQKEQPYSPEAFTKEIFLARVADENKLILDTLTAEKKVIPGVYVHREDMEIKLREWIGARANIFFIAAEAGSGKTNLMVEMQKQYTERKLPSLLIRAGRMEKHTLHEQLCYLLNIDKHESLANYPALAGTQDAPTFVFIDGLNEAYNAEKLWAELFVLSLHFEPGTLKFVISSRANTAADINRFVCTDTDENVLYGDKQEGHTGLSAYTFWLTALNMAEMKGAWDNYVITDKNKYKPQFSFETLATFDRALYSQISNPLVLRIFLETYHNKTLPKKGSKHLNIWHDWLASFSKDEIKLMVLLAQAVWDKGENELLLDDLLNDAVLKPYLTTDLINAPYPRLKNLGWISRYVKDLNACVSFTVEGALLYLMGTALLKPAANTNLESITKVLTNGTKLQQAAIATFLDQQALKGNLEWVSQLIDAGQEYHKACNTAMLLYVRNYGIEALVNNMFSNTTENDWHALLLLNNTLNVLQEQVYRKKLLKALVPINPLNTKPALILGLKACSVIDREQAQEFYVKCEFEVRHLDDAEVFQSCGDVNDSFGQYDKALVWYQKCLDIELKTLGAEHPSVATSYNNIGLVYNNKGEYDKALEWYQKCLDIYIKTLGAEHPSVATSYNNIGLVCDYKREYDKALEWYKKCLDIYIKTLGAEHPSVATSYNNIGSVCKHKGEYDKALEWYQKCLDIELKTLGVEHPSVATSYNNIGSVCYKKGEYDKALEWYQKCLDIELKNLGAEHPSVATSYNNIGSVCKHKGEYDKALEWYQKCLDIKLKTLGAEHPSVATSYFKIGSVCENKGEYDKALEWYQKCLDIELKTLGVEHPSVATSYNNIGSVCKNKGEYDKALEWYQKCLDIELKNLGAEHHDVATSYFNIGICQQHLESYTQAIESFAAGYKIDQKGGYPFQIACCKEKLNKPYEAMDFYIQSAEIRKNDPDFGPDHERTLDSINNVIRLVKIMAIENELPDWIKQKYLS